MGSLQFNTDGGNGGNNAGLCDYNVGLEGCSKWAARLGPHPHTPLKLEVGLSFSEGFLSECAHPCVIVQSFIYTSFCQNRTATHKTCPICPSWEVTVRSLRVGGPRCVYTIWQPTVTTTPSHSSANPPLTLK